MIQITVHRCSSFNILMCRSVINQTFWMVKQKEGFHDEGGGIWVIVEKKTQSWVLSRRSNQAKIRTREELSRPHREESDSRRMAEPEQRPSISWCYAI